MSRLAHRNALVIGGSRGIGAGIVRILAENGANVIFTYLKASKEAISLQQEIKEKGGFAAAVQADAANLPEMKAVMEKLTKQHGKLDILVNNAGLFVTGTIGDRDKDDLALSRMWDVNVWGIVKTVDLVVKYLHDGGRIITIGSGAADRSPFPGIGDYSAGKAALAAFTRSWARDLAERNITVNIIQPGLIHTDLVPDDPEKIKQMAQPIALKRLGTPREIGHVVAFLASDEASYITGATIDVDGGLSA